jgi:hypothetical protein
MKSVALTLAVLISGIAPVAGQKIETQTSDRSRVVHLRTALSHLTVIEVSEPVVQVAAGSPSFKVEWRENKVFVQPTEAEAATNLFIWTASQRLNYELEPAGSVATMDFAVDQLPAHSAEVVTAVKTPPQVLTAPAIAAFLLEGKAVRMQPSKQQTNKSIQVWIRDLYERDGRLLIRYAVRNQSTQPFAVSAPQVYQLDGVRSPQSLYGLVNSQLSDEQVAKLKVNQEIPVKVLDGQVQTMQIAPGEDAVGIVALEAASSTRPIVLRLQFPGSSPFNGESANGQKLGITAFLVR